MSGLPDNIELSTNDADLFSYGFDASGMMGRAAMVAWPRSTDDVSALLKYASERGIAIVPRGAGTGMTAGSVPREGAMVLSFERMNRTLELDAENLNVVVEPGLINARLQRELDPLGFFYPPDPASMKFCTLGGNVAENAGGPRALKYGVTRDFVMQLEAVLPTGEVITTGVQTHKGVVGYDLTRLLTGSEGTLAAITKIRLRVLPKPEAVLTLLATFSSVEAAGKAVSGITSARIIPRTLEFMDRQAIWAVEQYKPTGLPTNAEALLLIELDGHPRAIQSESDRVASICRTLGADVTLAQSEHERERLWDARRAISPALHHLNMKKISEDIVVPRGALPEMLGYLRELSSRTGIMIVNFGHAGDGNIHVNIMGDPTDPHRLNQAYGLVGTIFEKVLSMGGTISGEHGVGLTKADYISMEIKPTELALMRAIKDVFDPKGVMNPGKIWRTEEESND